MRKIFTIFFYLVIVGNVFAQNKLTISGKLTDENKKPIESATIYLSAQRDSTLIDYTISDTKGGFSLPVKKIDYPVFVSVSSIGYEDYTQKFDAINENVDLKTLLLKSIDNQLEEMVITADVAPIRIKQDTLEFNASSFKVRPDATVKELLEQLPGVEVDDQGKIKVNGKEVNNVLVNGKPFFNEDGKVAMENLPADIIKKVQVTDYKTKEEKITGSASTSDSKTLNLTIDDDKNKGLFGKAIAGYGSDDRYESSLLFNYFNKDLKVSLLASSNNINSTGFSTNEIFDNMSGGRNTYFSSSSDGTMSVNGMSFGGGQGIFKTNLIGLNYSDSWGKKIKSQTSYLYNEVTNENKNISRIENLLPDNKFVTASQSETKSKVGNHTFSHDFELQIDSLSTLIINPKLSRGITTSRNISQSETVNELGEMLNKSDSKDILDVDTYSFENEIMYSRRLKRKGRSISFTLNNKNSKNETNQLKDASTFFYQTNLPNDIRNQTIKTNSHKDEYEISIRYREPITAKQSFNIALTGKWNNEYRDRQTKDFSQTTNDYTEFNSLLSFANSLSAQHTTPTFGYMYRGEKFYINTNVGTEFVNYDVNSSYNFQNYLNDRFDILPKIYINSSITVGKSSNIYVSYNYGGRTPQMDQLLEYEDLSNPLFTTKGNKDLLPEISHNPSLYFSNYDYQSRSGYYFYSGLYYYERTAANATVYDENYKGTSTYINVKDTYYYYFGGNFSKSYNIGKNKLSYSLSMGVNASKSKGMLNNELYDSKGTTLNPGASFTWDYDKKIILKPSYEYTHTSTDYTNFTVDKAKNFIHTLSFMVTSYWPKNVVFGSDISYTYNSNISDGFKKDFILWNVSAGYNFYKDRFLAKVKVYDILNQNQNVIRTVSATSIADVQNTILKQYVMFSLTYKLEKFGGKKKNEWDIEEEE